MGKNDVQQLVAKWFADVIILGLDEINNTTKNVDTKLS